MNKEDVAHKLSMLLKKLNNIDFDISKYNDDISISRTNSIKPAYIDEKVREIINDLIVIIRIFSMQRINTMSKNIEDIEAQLINIKKDIKKLKKERE